MSSSSEPLVRNVFAGLINEPWVEMDYASYDLNLEKLRDMGNTNMIYNNMMLRGIVMSSKGVREKVGKVWWVRLRVDSESHWSGPVWCFAYGFANYLCRQVSVDFDRGLMMACTLCLTDADLVDSYDCSHDLMVSGLCSYEQNCDHKVCSHCGYSPEMEQQYKED